MQLNKVLCAVQPRITIAKSVSVILLGEAIPIAEVEDHIFGIVLMNDWSGQFLCQFGEYTGGMGW